MKWWQRLLKRTELERKLDAELQFHFDQQVVDNIRRGMSEDEARRAARLKFGGLEQVKEDCRDARGTRWLESVIQDVRFALRMLRRSPGFTLVAIASLALGIGANTAIFSLVNAVLLRPLPYPDTGRMVTIYESLKRSGAMNDSWPDYLDWRRQSDIFEEIAAIQQEGLKLSGIGEPRMLHGAWVSSSYFPLLALTPILGRTFSAAEDKPGAAAVAVLSYPFWRNILKADPHAIGKTIALNERAFTIVGVLPPSREFPYLDFELYVPIGEKANLPNMTDRENHPGIAVLARLRRGVSLRMARAEMGTIMGRLGRQYPDSNRNETAVLTPLTEQLVGGIRGKLTMLLASVGFVLLLACGNLAHMALGRANGRRRELAVRAALGASRGRLARQLLIENMLLAGAGAAVGLLLAGLSIGPLVKLYGRPVPGIDDAHIDGTVLLFTFGACLLSGVLFGFAPALKAPRTNVSAGLKESGSTGASRASRRWRSTLIAAEIAVALVLSICAGLTLRSLFAAFDVDPGFRADHLLAFDVIRSTSSNADALNLYSEALDRIGRLPGVKSASGAMCGPLGGTMWTSPYVLEGRPAPPRAEQPWTALNMIMPRYFQTLGTPLVEGRFFTDSDNAHTRSVAVVNQTMARRVSSKGSAIGKQIQVRYAAHPLLEIVGVVADIKQVSLDKPDMPEVYVPAAQMPVNFMTIVVRTSVEPSAVTRTVALPIRDLDKGQPLSRVIPLTAAVASGLVDRKFVAFLLASFGALGLLLAATGVLGVIAYTVAQRTREIGVRLAIGARPIQVLKLILWQGMLPALLGIAAGVGIAWEMTRLLAGTLFEVQPHDIPTFLGAGLLLAGVALAACYVPARRAMRIDPVVALRYE